MTPSLKDTNCQLTREEVDKLNSFYSILNSESADKDTAPRGVPVMAQQKHIWLWSMGTQVWSLALLSELSIRCCRELWYRSKRGLDPALLWLWCRPKAIALIWPLAWEPPYAASADLKRQEDQKRHCAKKTSDPDAFTGEDYHILGGNNANPLPVLPENRGVSSNNYMKPVFWCQTNGFLEFPPWCGGLRIWLQQLGSLWRCCFDPWPRTVG